MQSPSRSVRGARHCGPTLRTTDELGVEVVDGHAAFRHEVTEDMGLQTLAVWLREAPPAGRTRCLGRDDPGVDWEGGGGRLALDVDEVNV